MFTALAKKPAIIQEFKSRLIDPKIKEIPIQSLFKGSNIPFNIHTALACHKYFETISNSVMDLGPMLVCCVRGGDFSLKVSPQKHMETLISRGQELQQYIESFSSERKEEIFVPSTEQEDQEDEELNSYIRYVKIKPIKEKIPPPPTPSSQTVSLTIPDMSDSEIKNAIVEVSKKLNLPKNFYTVIERVVPEKGTEQFHKDFTRNSVQINGIPSRVEFTQLHMQEFSQNNVVKYYENLLDKKFHDVLQEPIINRHHQEYVTALFILFHNIWGNLAAKLREQGETPNKILDDYVISSGSPHFKALNSLNYEIARKSNDRTIVRAVAEIPYILIHGIDSQDKKEKIYPLHIGATMHHVYVPEHSLYRLKKITFNSSEPYANEFFKHIMTSEKIDKERYVDPFLQHIKGKLSEYSSSKTTGRLSQDKQTFSSDNVSWNLQQEFKRLRAPDSIGILALALGIYALGFCGAGLTAIFIFINPFTLTGTTLILGWILVGIVGAIGIVGITSLLIASIIAIKCCIKTWFPKQKEKLFKRSKRNDRADIFNILAEADNADKAKKVTMQSLYGTKKENLTEFFTHKKTDDNISKNDEDEKETYE